MEVVELRVSDRETGLTPCMVPEDDGGLWGTEHVLSGKTICDEDAARKACSALKFSATAAGALEGVLDAGLIRSPLMLVIIAGFVAGGAAGTSRPAIALNRLGSGAFGSSVYSGRARKCPLDSTLTRSWVLSSSV